MRLICAYLILFLFIFCSCKNDAATDESAPKNKEKQKMTVEPSDTIEKVKDEFSIRNQSLYQATKEKNNTVLPDSLEWSKIKTIDPGLVFNAVLSAHENYLISNFYVGTDVENLYLFSFSKEGELIDEYMYGTQTYGEDVSTEMLNEDLLKVVKTSYSNFELDGYGNEKYDNKIMTSEYVSFSEMGVFEIWKNENPTINIEKESEVHKFYNIIAKSILSPQSFDFTYRQNISAQSEGEDVYESLEGGGLNSKSIEVRDQQGSLKGIFCYTFDDFDKDPIPTTICMAKASKNCEIMKYYIVSAGGMLYLKIFEHNNTNNKAQINYFSYANGRLHSYPLLKKSMSYEEAKLDNNSASKANSLKKNIPRLAYTNYRLCQSEGSPIHQFKEGGIYTLETEAIIEKHFFFFSKPEEISTMVISSRAIDEPLKISAEPLKTTFTFNMLKDEHLKVSNSRNSILKKDQELCGLD